MGTRQIFELLALAIMVAGVGVLISSNLISRRRSKRNLELGYEQRLGSPRKLNLDLTSLDLFLFSITPATMQDSLQQKLRHSGKQGQIYLAMQLKFKFGLLLIGSSLTIASIGFFKEGALVACAISIALFFVPDLLLIRNAKTRREQIGNLLPDALDQLTLLVDSGLDFQTAFVRVCRNSSGFLNDEFQRTLSDLQLGYTRKDAFENLGERTGSPVLKNFARAMVLADLFGVPVSNVLRSQAQDLRQARRARAEEEAQKVPTKITFPLVVCFLPVILILLVAPSILKLLAVF